VLGQGDATSVGTVEPGTIDVDVVSDFGLDPTMGIVVVVVVFVIVVVVVVGATVDLVFVTVVVVVVVAATTFVVAVATPGGAMYAYGLQEICTSSLIFYIFFCK
jgi:hypothetical protein